MQRSLLCVCLSKFDLFSLCISVSSLVLLYLISQRQERSYLILSEHMLSYRILFRYAEAQYCISDPNTTVKYSGAVK